MNNWKLPTKHFKVGSWLGIISSVIATLIIFESIFELLYYAIKNSANFSIIGTYLCLFLFTLLLSVLTGVLSFNIYQEQFTNQHIAAILIIIFNCISLAFWLIYCFLSFHSNTTNRLIGEIISIAMVVMTMLGLVAGVIMALEDKK